jgi:hypothetical protein
MFILQLNLTIWTNFVGIGWPRERVTIGSIIFRELLLAPLKILVPLKISTISTRYLSSELRGCQIWEKIVRILECGLRTLKNRGRRKERCKNIWFYKVHILECKMSFNSRMRTIFFSQFFLFTPSHHALQGDSIGSRGVRMRLWGSKK